MRTVMLLAAFAATLLLALASAGASALRSLNFGQREIRKTGREILFTEEGEGRFTCEVSFAKTLIKNPIPKTAGTNIGENIIKVVGQERAEERCSREGRAKVPSPEIESRLDYVGFTGTLPLITGILLEIFAFAVLVTMNGGASRCLYGGSIREMFVVNEGSTRLLRVLETPAMTLRTTLAGSLFCSRTLRISGTLSSAAAVAVQLI